MKITPKDTDYLFVNEKFEKDYGKLDNLMVTIKYVKNPKLEFIKLLTRYDVFEKDRNINTKKFPHTSIGSGCEIHPLAAIGEDGFGYEYDETGRPLLFPHGGDVVIGNDVRISSFVSIHRGTIDNTWIGDRVKFDSHVHVAHNCVIGHDTRLCAGAILGGSVTIGHHCFIGLNVTIKDHVNIGDFCIIGSGANITRDLQDYRMYYGTPSDHVIKDVKLHENLSKMVGLEFENFNPEEEYKRLILNK